MLVCFSFAFLVRSARRMSLINALKWPLNTTCVQLEVGPTTDSLHCSRVEFYILSPYQYLFASHSPLLRDRLLLAT